MAVQTHPATESDFSRFRLIVRQFGKLGLADVIAPVAEVLDRDRRLVESLTARRLAAEQVWARSVSALAGGGEITDAVFAELSAIGDVNASGHLPTPVATAVRHARGTLAREAEQAGCRHADAMFAALRRVADAAVAEAATVKLPRSVVDGETMLAARLGPGEFDRLTTAGQRFAVAHEAYRHLRERVQWLPPVRAGEGEGWAGYRHPYRSVRWFGITADDADPRPRARLLAVCDVVSTVHADDPSALPVWAMLAHSISAGAEPGMYSAAEAEQNHRAWWLRVQAEREGRELAGAMPTKIISKAGERVAMLRPGRRPKVTTEEVS